MNGHSLGLGGAFSKRLAGALIAGAAILAGGAAQAAEPTLGDALLGGVKKSRVVRTMPGGPFGERGALQRTMFLDVVGSNKNLEIAFVLDGTDSMGQDIQAAVRSMGQFVEQLRKMKSRDANITFALVVYRDRDAPSGPVKVMVDRFTANAEAFNKTLATVKTETGAPWFQEQVDVGLYTAMTKLPWSAANDKDYTRWIVLCGDARPYNETGKDKPFRKHSTSELIRTAKEKNIQLYTIVCRSGFSLNSKDNAELFATAKAEHPAFKAFAGQLASATGGGVLDLWDQQLVAELAAAAKGATQTYQRLEAITTDDIAAARSNDSVGAPVRVAVLPHMKLDRMSSDADKEEVQLAAELRLLLNKAPQMRVTDAGAVADAIAAVDRTGKSDTAYLAEIAKALHVDFVLWGDYATKGDSRKLTTRLYRAGNSAATVVAEAEGASTMKEERRPSALTISTLATLLDRAAGALEKTPSADKGWVTTFAAMKKKDVPAETGDELTGDSRAKRQLLAGLERLEQTLTQSRQDASSVESANKLAEAADRFEQALSFEPDNPFTQLMLASASLNLAKHRDYDANMKRAYAALTAAYENREKTPNLAVREEIMGDYSLLVQKDFKKAAEHYTKLTTDPQFRDTRFALRAHWMLAGIYMGDWGVNDYEAGLAKDKLRELSVIDLAKAREHILAILANWDRTPQADFFRTHIDTLRTQDAVRIPQSQKAKQYVDMPVGELQLVAY
jgi:hypothetical protein